MSDKDRATDPHIISEMCMAYIDGYHGKQCQDYEVGPAEQNGMRNVLALLITKGYAREAERKPGEDVIERLARWEFKRKSDMIEREGVYPVWKWEDTLETTRQDYLQWAKAAIAALAKNHKPGE